MIRAPWSLVVLPLSLLFATANSFASLPAKNLCRLSAASRDLSVGFSAPTRYVPSVGTLKGAMFFVDFEDAPANDTIESLYHSFLPDATNWYSTASYGRLDLVVKVDKSKFYRMPKRSTAYKWDRSGADQEGYISDAVKAIGKNGNFGNGDVLYIVPTRAAKQISFSPTRMYPVTLQDGTVMRTAVTFGQDVHLKYGFKTLNHETGHSMGLPDLYPSDSTKLARGAWVGGYDIMGLINGTSPDFFAWHKWKLGWLDDNQIDCISMNGTSKHHITPLEVPGGVKAAAVKLSSTKAFVVELRTTAAYNASCSIGLVGYVINTAGSNWNPKGAPIEVLDTHTTDRGCAPARGGKLTGAALSFARGEKVMDVARYGIKVTIDGTKNGDYDITINWNGKSDAATSPKSGGGYAGFPSWGAAAGDSEESDDE